MAMIDDIVERLIEELRKMPNGTEATIAQLVNKCGYAARTAERKELLRNQSGQQFHQTLVYSRQICYY